VIEPAVTEINRKSEYRIAWQRETEGRKVVALKFDFEIEQQRSFAL
jgi:plasmid replication initiation protein